MKQVTIFQNMTSKTPLPGDLEKLVEFMKTDEKLKFLTQSYRLTGKKTYKADAPLFAPACYLEGGKGQDNIRELTHLSLVDFDELFTEVPPDITALNALKQKLCDDPHTLLCYITMSGNGIRVIYPYEGDDYPAAFAKGNDYYQQLIGKKADFQCKNVNRLSGLAYDPDAYYKSCAKPFTAEEISKFHTEATKKNQQQKKQDRINTYYEQFIKPKLAADKIIYEPGNHNNYVMRVGYMLAKKRYAHADVLKWALQMFPEYNGVEQVIKSCYDNTPGASRKASGGGGGGGGNGSSDNRFASVEEIRIFLDGHIHLRYNLITQRYEFQEIPEGASSSSAKLSKWQILLDRHVNSLWTKMSLTLKVNKLDMRNIIESDYTPVFNPFEDYFAHIPPWKEGDKDYIAELAATVKVKDTDSSVLSFEECLRKWLVAMIAGWLDPEAVNNVILVYIGRQGANKTTWFNHLLPPELKQYFYTKTNAKRMTKDDLIALSQYALICCEELDTMSASEMNQLKAAVTMQYINERAAYAHYAEQRKHINSFCGTGNNPEFLNDPTGTRRWLPFEVESIVSPRQHPFNHPGIYAQAYALYKSGYRYWFTDEEIERQNRHNSKYETPRLEQELVDLYFRKPSEGETGEFVSAARAMQIIGCNITQKLSSQKISKAFGDLGFNRLRTKHSRGFIAIIRTAEEIRNYQISLGIDASSNLPF